MAQFGITRVETVADDARVPLKPSASRGLRAVLFNGVVAATVFGCSAPAASTIPTTMVAAPIPTQVGQVVRMGADHLEARVLDVGPLSPNTAVPESFGPARYETVTYELINPTPQEELFMPRLQALVADQQSFPPDRDATIAIGQTLIPRVIGPDATVRCKIAFAIPKKSKDLEVAFSNTEGVQWRIDAH